LSGLSRNVPRVIALIDLHDLQWQVKRIGGEFGQDVSAVVEHLETGLAKLDQAWSEVRVPLSVVYVYLPLDADSPREAERVVFKWRAGGVNRACWACYKACTHCQEGNRDSGGQVRDNPMAGDLIELAREDEYDWAVVVSRDLRLIPVVRYVQSRGRKIIHGSFPPIAMDLTSECWASINLGVFTRPPK
jgi:NYN domain